jgi:hypothetical protein
LKVIKQNLRLSFLSVVKSKKPVARTGWLFAVASLCGNGVTSNGVVGIGAIPQFHEFAVGIADVFPVENGAGEGARNIQAVGEGGIGTKGDRQVACKSVKGL